MATRTIYAKIRIELNNDNVDEITDEEVENFVENCLYEIPSTEETEVADTQWESTDY